MGAEATLRMILLGEDRTAGRALKGVGAQAEHTEGRVRRLGKAASVALVAGFVAAGAAALKFGKAAAEDEKSANLLATAMRNNAGATKQQIAATEDWITAQGKALGVADDDLRPALSNLVRVTHDVGKAQKLASLAMDISAGTGKSLSTVSMALARAQNGNVTGLGRLGVATKDADGKTKSLKQITEQLAATYNGSAAKAADTTAGKQRRLTVELHEAEETIGYKLIPAMMKLTNVALNALGWMEKHKTLVKVLAITLGTLAGAVVAVNTAVRIWTAVQTALDVVLTANPIGLVIVAIAALVAGIVIAYKKSETFRTIVNGAFSAIGKAADLMWNYYLKPVFKFWLNTWFTIVGALLNGAAKAFGWVPGIGGKLKAAAKEFNKFKNSVNDSLDGVHRNVDIKFTLKTTGNAFVDQAIGAYTASHPAHHAVGSRNYGGGTTWVGERGPELVNLPRGSRIFTAADSARMGSGSGGDLGTLTLVMKSEDGKVIEQKLVKFQRDQGGRTLAFVSR